MHFGDSTIDNFAAASGPVLPNSMGFQNSAGPVLPENMGFQNADGNSTTTPPGVQTAMPPVAGATVSTAPATAAKPCGCQDKKTWAGGTNSTDSAALGMQLIKIAAAAVVVFGVAYLFFAGSNKAATPASAE